MNYSHPEYLTSAEDVLDGIERRDKRLRIFDTTVYLIPDPPRYRVESGRDNYLKGHIPTAGLLDLTRGMSDASSPLAFTLPGVQQLQDEFRKYGVADDSLVVLYSTTHIMWATRLWWMLHWAGHKNVTLLDGGYTGWIEAGLPIDNNPTPYPTSSMTVVPQPGLWATTRGSARRGRQRRRVHDQRTVAGRIRRHVENELRPARTHPGEQEPVLRLHPERPVVPQRR